MGIEFGKNARSVHDKGDILVSFQYVNHEEAMCMFPSKRRASQGAGAVVICLSSAFKYADDDYLVRQAKEFARVMGFHNEHDIVKKIADIITWGLIHLCTMKPEPGELEERADVDLSINGNKLVLTADIRN